MDVCLKGESDRKLTVWGERAMSVVSTRSGLESKAARAFAGRKRTHAYMYVLGKLQKWTEI